jgi:ParB family transcriptional regulator, chromosome partitioning protein
LARRFAVARKQSDYLTDILAEDTVNEAPSPAPSAAVRARSSTLLSRESALARVQSGEVRQVTQLLLDPARVRVWPGNARHYGHLTEENCRDLIDSIVAEGGQKVPAVVRRLTGDPDYDFEVIAGTRRHWSIGWLRNHSYPDMLFLAQVVALDDEAAFRLADLENRARRDISDIERARNYAAALDTHYGGKQKRMAGRLRVSEGWLSKMLHVAAIPDSVLAAFASLADVQLKPAYALARALDDKIAAKSIVAVARTLAKEQAAARDAGLSSIPSAEVLRRLLAAADPQTGKPSNEAFTYVSRFGRTALTVQSMNRQGVTVRLHAGSGADHEELADALRETLGKLEAAGKGVKR